MLSLTLFDPISCLAAPKAARSEYEQYLKAVGELLGGDTSTEELQEAAQQVRHSNNKAVLLPRPSLNRLGTALSSSTGAGSSNKAVYLPQPSLNRPGSSTGAGQQQQSSISASTKL